MKAEQRDVQIQWHGEVNTLWAKVWVNKKWDGNEDDHDIFFYFETEEEYEKAKELGDNGFEFRIVGEDR